MGDRSYRRDDDRRYQSGRDDRREYSDRDRYEDKGGREYNRDRNTDNRRDYDRDDRGRNRSPPHESERYDSGNLSRTKLGGGGEKARDESNTNSRIYITGLPPDITEDDLVEHFGMLGRVARKKQKRGYPDQWPYKISIYKDDAGKCKGDAALTYEDFNAAQSAPEFFNNSTVKGATIQVTLAEEKAGADYGDGGSRGERGGFDSNRGRQDRFGGGGRDFRGGRDDDRGRGRGGGDRSRGGFRDNYREDRGRDSGRY